MKGVLVLETEYGGEKEGKIVNGAMQWCNGWVVVVLVYIGIGSLA